MAEPTRQPAFFCPQCQQKHRADLTPLEKRPGAVMRTVCRGCKSKLLIRMEAGAPLVEVESPPEAPESLGGPYEAAVDLKPGTKAGRFEIQGLTRQGRMSTVYRAHDPETKRTVGLNVLHADAPQDQRDRFRHQVEVQGGIRHPNVLPVYDRGELADRRPFFAAEHLHEPLTLGEILTRSRSGDLEGDDHLAMLGSTRGLVEHVLLPIAEGVYVANIESEVAHRDLRPENIVVDGRTGRPYLNEFGFAASLEAGAAKPRTLPLSPYVAPETAAGRVHPRTDVWGLGALLHLLLSGEAPIEGHGRALLDAVRNGTMRELPDDADPALSAIARKASAPDPEQRYVNARQLAADLRAWIQGRAVRAVDTFGDRGAHKEEVRAALRRGAKVALWGVVGLAVGLLVGSQIRLRGEGGIAPGLAAASSEVDRLVREVDALAERADRLSVQEGGDVWSNVLRRTTDLGARLSSQEEGETRRSLEGRLEFVRARFDTHLLLSLPDGVSVRIRNALTGEERDLTSTDGPIQLAPGLYDVRNAGGQPLRFPVLAGLHVRRAGSRGEGPRIQVAVPDATPPPGAVLVVEGEVPSRAPWTRPGRRHHVPAFFLDRHPVSNEAYALFLGALAPEKRESHLPATSFTWNPEQQTASVESGKGGEPVQGLSPRNAEAYCAWRSKEEGRPVTLPDENQWMLAAGASLMPDDPRCAGLEIPATPYGAFGLRTGPLELARTADDGGKAGYVSKGMRDEEDSPASTVFSRETVGADQRGAVTFRCARKIVATP